MLRDSVQKQMYSLKRPCRIGQYCQSMRQAVDRAQRGAASLADGTDPPDPGGGRRDPDSPLPRQEEGRLPSCPKEGSRNPSASSGPNDKQVELQEKEEVEEDTYFSPRKPSPDQDSSEEELRRHRYGRHRSRRGRHRRRSFSPVGKGAAGEVSFPLAEPVSPKSQRHHMLIQQGCVTNSERHAFKAVLAFSCNKSSWFEIRVSDRKLMKSALEVGDCDELGSTHRVEMGFDVGHAPCFSDEMTSKSVTVVNT